MRSCGAASRKKPFRPSAACASLFSSPIEPELSKTIITFAGLRSARQACLSLTSTFGSGSRRTRLGCAGSTPLARVTSPAGATSSSAGRKPWRPASSGVTCSARKSREDPGGAALLGAGPLQRHQRVVGEERAVGRVDRDEPLAVAGAAVEVQQRDLLHRHRRRVAEPAAAHLVGDEQRRVAVVDDRALELADLRPRAGDVGLGQALLLADRRVVGGRDRGQAGRREVRVGVHVLEAAELRPADRGPAAGRQLRELRRSRAGASGSRRRRPTASTSRSRAACGRSTGSRRRPAAGRPRG